MSEDLGIGPFGSAPAGVDDGLDDAPVALSMELEESERSETATGDADGPSTEAGNAASARRASIDKALIRRVAAKALALQGAPKAERAALAALLRCQEDPADLTVAVLAAPRSATQPVTDLLDLASSDVAEAAVNALILPKPRRKAAWALAAAIGAIKGQMPPSDAKAAKDLARAMLALEPAKQSQLRQIAQLARKSA